MARLVVLLALAAASAWPSTGGAAAAEFSKCCAAGEQLTENGWTCVPAGAAGPGESLQRQVDDQADWQWMPSGMKLRDPDAKTPVPVKDLQSTDASGNRRVRMGAGRPCAARDTKVVYWDSHPDGLDWSDAALYSLYTNGSLAVTQVADGLASYFRPDRSPEGQSQNEHTFLFPPSTFCMDRLHNPSVEDFTHAILLCPCAAAGGPSDVACVRKCCLSEHFGVVGEEHEPFSCNATTGALGARDWHPGHHRHPADRDDGKVPFLLEGPPVCSSKEVEINMLKKAIIFNSTKKSGFRILRDGSAVTDHFGEGTVLAPGSFCGEITAERKSLPTKPRFTANLLYCVEPGFGTSATSNTITAVLAPIGAVCLALTLLVYAYFPTLHRSLFSWNLMAHIGSMLVAYICMAVNALAPLARSRVACQSVAFIMQASLLASFFWLNVLCIYIALMFSGIRHLEGVWDKKRRRKFLWFSLYAWGGTALITITTAAVHHGTDPRTQRFHPEMGAVGCWFKGKASALLFFYGPLAVLLLANVALFIFTAVRIYKAPRATTSDTTSEPDKMQRLKINLQLFGLMGVSWLTEIVAFLVDGPAHYWYVADVINLLRAVFIFVFLCFKREVWDLVVNRLKGADQVTAGSFPTPTITEQDTTSPLISQPDAQTKPNSNGVNEVIELSRR